MSQQIEIISAIQPVYDKLEELLLPVKEHGFKAISVSVVMSDSKVINKTVHVYDTNVSGVADTYEHALALMSDEREKIKQQLISAKFEVSRLEKKLGELTS